MSSFDIILIKTNDFDEQTLVLKNEPNFTKDNYDNFLKLKTNYLDIEKSIDLISPLCEIKTVEDNEDFMTESVKFLGIDEKMIDMKECYEFKELGKLNEYSYQIMHKIPCSDDNLEELGHNLLASLITFEKQLLYGNAVLIKTHISVDNKNKDNMSSCTLNNILEMLMSNRYHMGVYIRPDNHFEDIFFNREYKIVDPFNNWKERTDIEQIMINKDFGTLDRTYYDFCLRIFYEEKSDYAINEPVTRLIKGFAKGNAIIISPYNDQSFYEINKENVLDLLKDYDKLKHQDKLDIKKNDDPTKYQMLYLNI